MPSDTLRNDSLHFRIPQSTINPMMCTASRQPAVTVLWVFSNTATIPFSLSFFFPVRIIKTHLWTFLITKITPPTYFYTLFIKINTLLIWRIVCINGNYYGRFHTGVVLIQIYHSRFCHIFLGRAIIKLPPHCIETSSCCPYY